MGWHIEDVMEGVRTYVASINKQEGLNLLPEDLDAFQVVIGDLAEGMVKKLNEITEGEPVLRAWIEGLMLLSYVRMRSIGMEKWKEATQDVLESLKCLFPIIDPRCN